jgi:hypothetical protein
MGVNIRITSGPAIEKQGDLAAILTNLNEGDVLFIDEIHRLSRSIEEILYPAMEDYALDIIIGKGPAARSIRIDLPGDHQCWHVYRCHARYRHHPALHQLRWLLYRDLVRHAWSGFRCPRTARCRQPRALYPLPLFKTINRGDGFSHLHFYWENCANTAKKDYAFLHLVFTNQLLII